jgi:hypothetical protein
MTQQNEKHPGISEHYLNQLIEEAVGRWVAMCKPAIEGQAAGVVSGGEA